MGLKLENPKHFLPLLLFIGFVYSLFGIGWMGLAKGSDFLVLGFSIIIVAVALWTLIHRRKMGL